MAAIDVESLIQALSPDDPCGPELQYDAAFLAMERAAAGTPERLLANPPIPAEPPNWAEVQRQALALLARSKDLRTAVYLTRALLHTHGIEGLRDGLALVKGLLEAHWDGLHPRLDPEDGNEPTQRLNALASLGDSEGMLLKLRAVSLVASRGLGRFAVRDVEMARGKLSVPAGQEPPALGTIQAAFSEIDLAEHRRLATALGLSLQHVRAIESLLVARAGESHAPDFGKLAGVLKTVQEFVAERLSERLAQEPTEIDEPAGDEAGDARPASPPPRRLNGSIQSREDVVRVLDSVCEYLVRTEPTNPAPLFIDCAKRLMSKGFIEIMRDLGPEGVALIEKLRGGTPR